MHTQPKKVIDFPSVQPQVEVNNYAVISLM